MKWELGLKNVLTECLIIQSTAKKTFFVGVSDPEWYELNMKSCELHALPQQITKVFKPSVIEKVRTQIGKKGGAIIWFFENLRREDVLWRSSNPKSVRSNLMTIMVMHYRSPSMVIMIMIMILLTTIITIFTTIIITIIITVVLAKL